MGIHRVFRLTFVLVVVATSQLSAEDVLDTQQNAPPLTPPKEAAETIKVPPGFLATLFASEPEVRQPIAITTDARPTLGCRKLYLC